MECLELARSMFIVRVGHRAKNKEGCLRVGTHETFILNSKLLRMFLRNVKGGSGMSFFFADTGRFPAQRIMYHFPKS